MIVVVGASHKTAPIDVRERITIHKEQLHPFVASIRLLPEVKEACVISTCNRIEVYAVTTLPGDNGAARATSDIQHAILGQNKCQDGNVLPEHIFCFVGDAAVRHLFRVASSLDSLVVGEAQILGQVKEAFDIATEAGTVGPILGRAFEWSFHVAKRVRSETQIGAGSVSVSSVAVNLATQIFGSLHRRTVVLMGAGTMGEAAARHLHDAGSQLVVINRNLERAESIAARFGGSVRSWDLLQTTLAEADVVIASTGSTDFVLTPALLAPLIRKRRGRSLFVIDIAVPRNVDPMINELDGVYLYDIDDLSKIASETAQDRSKEALIAEQIVADEANAFDAWMDSLQVTPAIVALRTKVRAVLEGELNRSMHGKLKHLGDPERKALEEMISAAVNKLTHYPAVKLKAAAAEGNARRMVDVLLELFHIGQDQLDSECGGTQREESG